MTEFKYTKHEVATSESYEAMNDFGVWIECIGGMSHAVEVASTFGTAYRRVETTTRAYVYEAKV